MAIDLTSLGDKVRRYREQLQLSIEEVADSTGISVELVRRIEAGEVSPTGDQILIFADLFRCDYRFFISNEKLAPFEQTENLYRRYGNEFHKADRQRVQEFLFLCECEEYIRQALGRQRVAPPKIPLDGDYYKGHGEQAALLLRAHFGYEQHQVPSDVYGDFRQLGWHLFRRRLSNSNISGLFLRHPVAGNCILVNFSEDVYRQRFSAAHEAAHALMDSDQEFVVSFWKDKDLREIRANRFASCYLLPPEFLRRIPEPTVWSAAKALEWASRMKVSTEALSIALLEAGLISDEVRRNLSTVRVARDMKSDPELPDSLAPNSRERKLSLLQRGLSSYYVSLCFDAYDKGLVSARRLAEILLCTEAELGELAALFGRDLLYAG